MTSPFQIALAHHRADRIQAAEAGYLAVLKEQPDHSDALGNLGSLYKAEGRYAEAEPLLRRAVELSPQNPDYQFNLGNLLLDQSRWAEAVDQYRLALGLLPTMWSAVHNMAFALERMGRAREAVEAYRQTTALNPTHLGAYLNLGTLLEKMGLLSDAAAVYRQAIHVCPGRHEALNNLGQVEQSLGLPQQAIATLMQALGVAGDDHRVASNVLMAQQYLPGVTDAAIRETAASYGARFPRAMDIPISKQTTRRLKIGYVSADFGQHVAGLLVRDVISRHNQSSYEIFLYSNRDASDELSRHLRQIGHWRSIEGKGDEAVLAQIRADGIDILVDLSGHTRGNRLPVFARRAAPVQISWLGYFATTGVPAIDYAIMDAWHVPAGAEAHFTERVIRLPHNRLCYKAVPFAPPVSEPPFVRQGHVTFGSFNNSAKINDEVLATWARIMAAVPDSRLILKWRNYVDAPHAIRVLSVMASHGIDGGRIDLRPESSHEQLLAEYADIDITLDPFPFSGGYTSCESLWMGVPVVTLPQTRPVSRQTWSFLNNIGLPGLAAADIDGYVGLASALANSPQTLVSLRAELRQRMEQSPLCDSAAFVGNLEAAYELAWTDAQTRSRQRDEGRASKARGIAAFQAGDAATAEPHLRHALTLVPDDAELHALLGVVLRMRGADPAQRIACYRQAVALEPENSQHHRNLAAALNEAKANEEALAHARRAVDLDPTAREGWYILGAALAGSERWSEAAALFDRLRTEHPTWSDAHRAAGECWRATGAMIEAGTRFLMAWDCLAEDAPVKDKVELLYSIGTTHMRLHRYSEAEPCMRYALDLAPDRVDIVTDHGNVLKVLNRLDEAEAAYRRAVAMRPELPAVHCNLGTIHQARGNYTDAIACYQQALTLQPGLSEAWSNLGTCMTYSPLHQPGDILAAYRGYDQHVALPLRSTASHPNDRNPDRRLRVGYVSADFRRHAVAYFAQPLLERLDPQRVEIFCYYSHPQVDDWTRAFQRRADHWLQCPQMSDADLAERIRADRIDILVDLSGHTLGHRLDVFARKPAPVQVTWMGYVTTTGLTAMDWRITNADADPPGTDEFYSERLWRLPGTMWCYRPLPGMPAPAPAPCLTNGHVTFGSLNRFSKNSLLVLESWARILAAVPESRLVICVPQGSVRDEVTQIFARFGVDSHRLEMFTDINHMAFWDLHGRIDIALDPFPFGGGTTTCETLWLGVPLVTMTGEDGQHFAPRFASRLGRAFLASLGLTELACPSLDRYIATAIRLASDVPRLAALRQDIRRRMEQAPLTDELRFAREMEDAYQAMWRDWVQA